MFLNAVIETITGCRNGDACPFIHDDAGQEQPSTASKSTTQRSNARQVPKERVVTKPVPNQDPRAFQINQIKRRFSARDEDSEDATLLHFSFHPSDPDFPFDLPKGLICVLHVLYAYPQTTDEPPRLAVKNSDMSRGYQINVERGFAKIVQSSPRPDLLAWLKEFDKQLEDYLIEQKADTITFVPNTKTPARVIPPATQTSQVTAKKPDNLPPRQISPPKPTYTAAQREQASVRHQGETHQLTARLGRQPLFQKIDFLDSISYTLPISPRKPSELPVPLQSIRTVKLVVPSLYPLEPCTIEILEVSKEAARKTEQGFARKARGDGKDMNLLSLVNWLAQSIHLLATEPDPQPEIEVAKMVDLNIQGSNVQEIPQKRQDNEQRHVIVISRPPEWSTGFGADDSSDSYGSGPDAEDSAEQDTDDDQAGVAPPEQSASSTVVPERGVSLNFPQMELRGIELLELVLLSLSVKCERCKTLTDVTNIKPSSPTDNASNPRVRTEPCKKCALPLSISCRPEFMHPTAHRAGYLDLTNCTPFDLLPSGFTATCASCSTATPPPGFICVRSPTPVSSTCRSCHAHLSLTLPSLKFLLASTNPMYNKATAFSTKPSRPEKPLGITLGTPLPSNGRCKHYARSYRWFRFSCCAKIYPCDKCHDEATSSSPTGDGHVNEHADRMLCGFCSREQNFRPRECGVCGASLVKRPGTGFWEGGKGTRDRARMSRKDPRKYKRRGGGAPVGGA